MFYIESTPPCLSVLFRLGSKYSLGVSPFSIEMSIAGCRHQYNVLLIRVNRKSRQISPVLVSSSVHVGWFGEQYVQVGIENIKC